MKTSRHQKLAQCKRHRERRREQVARRRRRIERRLRPRTWRAQPKPMYTASNMQYEHSDRVRGLGSGGIGAMHRLAQHTGLVEAIDRHVRVLKPGPKGPTQEVIAAVVDMKRRNPTWGCPRIAQQIALAFAIAITKDVVRRILAVRYRPAPRPDSDGPSWLTVLGHTKDSLWSLDLFRCESAILRTHWVLVVMDQCTRRIVGFGVHRGVVDGMGLCRMFNRATRGQSSPKYLSSDHDPLYRFHQWQANLRILDVQEIKTVPYVPLSHPFVERLIGTIRRECLDRTLFWTAADLEMKLLDFQRYYNGVSYCPTSLCA